MNTVPDKQRQDDRDFHKYNKLLAGCVVVVDRSFGFAVVNENDCWYSVGIDADRMDNVVADDSEDVDDEKWSMTMMESMVDEKDYRQLILVVVYSFHWIDLLNENSIEILEEYSNLLDSFLQPYLMQINA